MLLRRRDLRKGLCRVERLSTPPGISPGGDPTTSRVQGRKQPAVSSLGKRSACKLPAAGKREAGTPGSGRARGARRRVLTPLVSCPSASSQWPGQPRARGQGSPGDAAQEPGKIRERSRGKKGKGPAHPLAHGRPGVWSRDEHGRAPELSAPLTASC